eukprot:650599-Pleurochrysis_carterae.AAC.1
MDQNPTPAEPRTRGRGASWDRQPLQPLSVNTTMSLQLPPSIADVKPEAKAGVRLFLAKVCLSTYVMHAFSDHMY